MQLAVGDGLLSAADLHYLFHGQEHLVDIGLHLIGFDAFKDAVAHLLLLTGEHV